MLADLIGPILQEKYVDSGEIAGISTLVVRRGQIVLMQVGDRDREAGLPMTATRSFGFIR